MDLPLAVKAGDYNSIKERGLLINMIAEASRSGDFLSVRRLDGLTELDSSLTSAIRSNFHENGGFLYFVSGSNLYRIQPPAASPTNLGAVGGSGRGQILSNSKPGDNQIVILNGAGQGYVYDSGGLNQITDVDFYPSTSMTILNERVWFTRDGTNEMFASDVGDATSYDPLSFISAEYKPDPVQIVVSKKSALWSLGSGTMEYFQSVNDSTVPIRPVQGLGNDLGILAKNSFSEVDDYFAFLADDSTITLVNGTEMATISDLEFELKIRGDGTTVNPGFTESQIQNCVGFFVDTPHHKMYWLSFPDVNYTWGYDINTGLPVTRTSSTGEAWRACYSITYNNVIYMGDRLLGTIWKLDPDAKDEGGEILKATMRFPSISFTRDAFIPKIEFDMEVGVAENVSQTPTMLVSYSKDGGKTYINHSPISLGNWGEFAKRVVLRNFGRLVRHKDFILQLVVTDPVRFEIYAAEADVEFGV